MANEEHLAIITEGVSAWNSWRDAQSHSVAPDLRGANLNGVDLFGVNLSEADLRRANLSRANLSEANLSEANLSEAYLGSADLRGVDLSWADLGETYLSSTNLRGADLRWANLRGADLRGADLRKTDLHVANFNGANLRWMDLSKAKTNRTSFADVDLSQVRGLDEVVHGGPSTIGIDTIYKSGGNISEAFLRGCGVPDGFITYMASLVGKPIEFYSCFISYSTKDQEFAERLHNDLQARGVRCWFAPEDVQGGKKLHEQIEEAIRHNDKLLLVLSEHSMNSEWVKTEIYHARQQEKSRQRRKLFPISLVPFETILDWRAFDADSGKDMGREVREYFIPDFSNWKNHNAYKKAFDRLVRDLKAETANEERSS